MQEIQALWFGRGMTGYGEWHLGVYGYKRNPLEFYDTYEVEQEEQVEKLEQIRWLKNGWNIGCSSVYFNGIEINAPEDVDKWHSKNFPIKDILAASDMGAKNVWNELNEEERKQVSILASSILYKRPQGFTDDRGTSSIPNK